MTPKEKAIQLVHNVFSTKEGFYMPKGKIQIAKRYAILCVDEIIKSNPIVPLQFMLESEALDAATEYWNEVKSELKKL